MLLKDAYDTLYRPRQLRSASESTLRLWGVALRFFDKHLGRPATLDDLNDGVVCEFATSRRQSVSAATVNRDLASILALWRWLHRRGYVDRWPDVPLETEPIRTPIAWSQAEFSRLISTTRQLSGFVGDNQSNTWWTSLLLTCFDSGERIGAVTAIEWSDVDLLNRWVRFRAENRKGRDRDSLVQLAPDTVEMIGELLRVHRLVFPWPYHRNSLWKHYGAILTSAGLPNDRVRKFHCVRKTVASHAEAAGANATDLLRHASRKNTLAYLDPRILRPRQATDVLWRP